MARKPQNGSNLYAKRPKVNRMSPNVQKYRDNYLANRYKMQGKQLKTDRHFDMVGRVQDNVDRAVNRSQDARNQRLQRKILNRQSKTDREIRRINAKTEQLKINQKPELIRATGSAVAQNLAAVAPQATVSAMAKVNRLVAGTPDANKTNPANEDKTYDEGVSGKDQYDQ